DRVLDVGCGCGILAIEAALQGAVKVHAIDINPDAVAATRANADICGVGDRISVALGNFEEGVQGQFDVIVCNPPYWDRDAASLVERNFFDSGFSFLKRLVGDAETLLSPRGWLCIVSSDQGNPSLIAHLLSNGGWSI